MYICLVKALFTSHLISFHKVLFISIKKKIFIQLKKKAHFNLNQFILIKNEIKILKRS